MVDILRAEPRSLGGAPLQKHVGDGPGLPVSTSDPAIDKFDAKEDRMSVLDGPPSGGNSPTIAQSDEQLLARYAGGSLEAREELARRHMPIGPPPGRPLPPQQRGDGGPGTGRLSGPAEDDRPLRPGARRLRGLRGHHHPRRAQAPLPRPRLDHARDPPGPGALPLVTPRRTRWPPPRVTRRPSRSWPPTPGSALDEVVEALDAGDGYSPPSLDAPASSDPDGPSSTLADTGRPVRAAAMTASSSVRPSGPRSAGCPSASRTCCACASSRT